MGISTGDYVIMTQHEGPEVEGAVLTVDDDTLTLEDGSRYHLDTVEIEKILA